MDGHTRTGLHGAVRSMAASHRACSKASQPHQAIKQGDAASRSAACRRLTLSSAPAAASADAVTHDLRAVSAAPQTFHCPAGRTGCTSQPRERENGELVELGSAGRSLRRPVPHEQRRPAICGSLQPSRDARGLPRLRTAVPHPRAPAAGLRRLLPRLQAMLVCRRGWRPPLWGWRTAAPPPLRTPPTLPAFRRATCGRSCSRPRTGA